MTCFVNVDQVDELSCPNSENVILVEVKGFLQ